jgi:hypothetical protein
VRHRESLRVIGLERKRNSRVGGASGVGSCAGPRKERFMGTNENSRCLIEPMRLLNRVEYQPIGIDQCQEPMYDGAAAEIAFANGGTERL